MSFQPLPLTSAPPVEEKEDKSKSNKKNNTKDVIDEDYMKKLVGSGITNDVFAYSDKINQAYSIYDSMSEAERNTIRGKNLRRIMSGNDPGYINALLRNKETFQAGIKNVEEKKAQSSYAVTSNGIMAYDKKTEGIKEVSFNELDTNRDNYVLLTNSELINQREINPKLQGDTRTFVSLDNAASSDSVRDHILSYLNGIGTSSEKVESNRYTTGKDTSILKAIQNVSEMINNTFEDTSTISVKTNKNQIESALGAIYSSLPSNQKNFLRAEAIANGYTGEGIEQAVKSYIGLIANSKSITDTDSIRKIGLVDQDKVGGGSFGSKGSSKMDDMGWAQQVVMNEGARDDNFTLNFGTGFDVKVAGANYFNVAQSSDGAVTKPTMVSDIDTITSLGDMSNVTVGDVHVTPLQFSQIMYSPSRVTNAWLYVKEEDGRVMPDYDLTNRIEEAKTEVERNKATGILAQNIYKSHDIDTQIIKGQVVPFAKQREFVLMNVITNENIVDKKKNPILYKEDDSDEVKDAYKLGFDYVGGTPADSRKRKQSSYTRFFSSDPLIHTIMAIPKTSDTISGTLADKNKTKIDPILNTRLGQQMASQVIGKEKTTPIYENPKPKVVAGTKNDLDNGKK